MPVDRRARAAAGVAALAALTLLGACSGSGGAGASAPAPARATAAPAAPSPAAAPALPSTTAPAAPTTTPTGPGAGPGTAACPPTARILGLGDSIAGQAVGPATDRLAELGFPVRLDARWGTGPLDHDPDWLAVARSLEAEFRPDVVLVVFYGNYAQPLRDLDGRRIAPDTLAQLLAWGERSAEITAVFTDGGATVVWISPPPRPPGGPNGGRVSPTWDATRRAVEPDPRVVVADSGAVLAGPDGAWVATLTGPHGEPEAVRADDGVHLVPAGGDRMAAAIVDVALEVACGGADG